MPDLITGWMLVACGLVAAARRSTSRSGALLAVTGFAWFVPNFATTGIDGVDWLAAHAPYLHRGPLVALLLTYAGQRSRDRVERSALAAGLVLAFASAVWASRVGTLIVAAGLVAFAVGAYAAASRRARRLRLAAVRLTVPVALALAAITAVRVAVPTHAAAVGTLRGYEATLVAVSIASLSVCSGRRGPGRSSRIRWSSSVRPGRQHCEMPSPARSVIRACRSDTGRPSRGSSSTLRDVG